MNYTKLFFKLLKTYNINLYFPIREFFCVRADKDLIPDINSDPILQLIESSYKAENYYYCCDISKSYLSQVKWHPALRYTKLYLIDTRNYLILLDFNRILWYNEDMYNLGLKYIKQC